ncbi:hypothetical protein LEP1GSC008_0681 [Leptospira kirschneri serovar Bulgarica str. Nikolaevo]|uniref:Uncharacterized protein n=1 Tax=Leptospira kirschneri serovar Bulgarica str. Nikolaevo TaxID=1240687 RepID=M6F2C0_9LEPT|nr:hypothetical protein LEP1GSC008_0681 [Leptospira kirschneri serovar Bulgarica str. Nikolaevo]
MQKFFDCIRNDSMIKKVSDYSNADSILLLIDPNNHFTILSIDCKN